MAVVVWIAAACASGGTLRTLDGKAFEGEVRFTGEYFLVSSKTLTPVRVELANLLQAGLVGFESEVPLGRGVVLLGGTTLAIESIARADDTMLRVRLPGIPAAGPTGTSGGKKPSVKPIEVAIPLGRLARIALAPVPPALAARIPGGRTGVLLARGDFFEGELRKLEESRVSVSSVLFGIASFEYGREALMVTLRDPSPGPACQYLLRLADGSVLRCVKLTIEANGLLAETDEPSLPPLVVPPERLLEIRYLGDRLQPLALRRPSRVEGATPPGHVAPYMLDATTCGLPMALAGASFTRGIGAAGGVSLHYDLEAKYATFLCRAGVPSATLPLVTARFTVLVDGREAFTSAPTTSLREPLSISVPVRGARTLTLRVDSPAGLPVPGIWADPALLK